MHTLTAHALGQALINIININNENFKNIISKGGKKFQGGRGAATPPPPPPPNDTFLSV